MAIQLSQFSVYTPGKYAGLQQTFGLIFFATLFSFVMAIYFKKRRYQIGPNDFLLSDINDDHDKTFYSHTYDSKI